MKTLLLAAVAVVALLSSVARADLTPVPLRPLHHATADSLRAARLARYAALSDSARVADALRPEPNVNNWRAEQHPPSALHDHGGQIIAGACLVGLGALRIKDAIDISSANAKLPEGAQLSVGRPLLESALYLVAGFGVLSIRF